MAQRVIESGCDDPMALFFAAQAFREAGRLDLALDAFRRADDGSDATRYCGLYKILMQDAYNGLRPMPEVQEDIQAIRARFRSMFRDVLIETAASPKSRAVVWSKLHRFFAGSDQDMIIRIGDAMQQVEGADAWLINTFQANVEIQKAWAARGGGFANTVTDDGWQGYHEHIQNAERRAREAIAVDDTLPHPFEYLIIVGMAESDDRLMKASFDNAVRRQVDSQAAYDYYLYALTPRWGGSQDEMISVGLNALETGRFDTAAPSMLLTAISKIIWDQGSPLTQAQRTAFAPHIEKMAKGYEEKNPLPNVVEWARSIRIREAYRFKNWSKARELLRLCNDLVSESPFISDDLDPIYVLGEVVSRGGPLGERVDAALKTKNPVDREEAFNSILRDLPEAENGRLWLKAKAQTARLETAMAGGDWVDVPLDQELNGWRILRGNWKVDEGGALVGTSSGGLNIVTRFEIPGDYELRFELNCTKRPLGWTRALYFHPAWSPDKGVNVYVNLDEGVTALCMGQYSYAKGKLSVGDAGAKIDVLRDGNSYTLLDDAGAPVSYTFERDRTIPIRLAFGGNTVGDVGEWKISNLQVRKR
jgi:hypothetical protein